MRQSAFFPSKIPWVVICWSATARVSKVRELPRAAQNLQKAHPRDWQGRQMPRSSPGEGGAGRSWNWLMHKCMRKQGYHLEQLLHRLTSSCCLKGIQDGLDSGFHGDRFPILCELIFYFGFQSLAVFRNPWVVFWIPEPRISDCTSKDFPSSISAISCLLFLGLID